MVVIVVTPAQVPVKPEHGDFHASGPVVQHDLASDSMVYSTEMGEEKNRVLR